MQSKPGAGRHADGRRSELRQRLRRLRREGGVPGRRRLLDPGDSGHLGGPGDPGATPQLLASLPALGTVFAVFGRYLSTRPDLLPLRHCEALARLCRWPAPIPAEQLRALLETELAGARAGVEERLERLQTEPLGWDALHQWHRAELSVQGAVVVKVARPEATSWLEELELLALLEEVPVAGPDLEALDWREAIADFASAVDRQLDLSRQAQALQELAEAAGGLDDWRVPAPCRELSSRRLLVLADPQGAGLYPRRGGSLGADEEERVDRARRLWLAWLQLVLLEGLLPDQLGGDSLLLEGDSFAPLGGTFTRLEETTRLRLLDYLVACAQHDPDRACRSLLAESQSVARRDLPTEDELRMQLRQAEPLRDGGWGERYRGRRLAELLFVQWRLLRTGGRPPSVPLRAFYRSLALVEEVSRRLSPTVDGLTAAMADFRVIAAAAALRERAAPSRLAAELGRLLPLFDELRGRLDDALTLVREGRVELRFVRDEERREPRERADWRLVVGALLLMLALAGLALRIESPPWLDGTLTLLFLLLGGALLWLIGWRQ